MPPLKRVAIVGVGLLGGSIGLALKKGGMAYEVIGIGRHPQSLEEAVKLGAIDAFATSIADIGSGLDAAIVCTPVGSVAKFAIELCTKLSTDGFITDVGSTKRSICDALAGERFGNFCGSHPMAGSEQSGCAHADPNLFRDRLTILTPSETTSPQTTERVRQFWEQLGSRTTTMTPADHDEAVARTSHLPHVLAACLAAQTRPDLLPLVASGWADTTRVAAGHVEMWQQIISENRPAILESLRDFRESLGEWIATIDARDDHHLLHLLTAAKQNRDSVS